MNLFDCIAPIYGSSLRLRQASRDELAAYLGVAACDVVVDIGGGNGIGGRSAVQVSGCRALVVDRSAGMLRQAESHSRVSLVLGDAAHLPLPGDSVDGALCLDALHHFPDVMGALREIKRVLKPSSRLVVQELDRTHVGVRVMRMAEQLCGEPGNFWAPEELKSMLAATGFTSISIVNGRWGTYYAVAACQI